MNRFTARPATTTDHSHYARLFPGLGVDDPVMPVERWLATIAPAMLVLEDGDGAVVGYAYVQVLRGVGYVRHVVVDPGRRGQGLGRVLMGEIAGRLRAAGCDRWCLNVKPENEAAVGLYRAVGMTDKYTSTAFRFGWALVDRLPVGDREVIARVVEPGEDAAIEAAFEMPAGQIAEARKRPDMVLLRLVDPRAPGDAGVGFAAYDPRFPGAFPFRVGAPGLAGALLAAIRPYELPDALHMQVVSEDAALTEVLRAAGATVRLTALHMVGEVPARG